MQIRLLKQRGSVGDPIPPLSLRGARRKLMSIAATVSRWSAAPKQKLLDDPADEPISGEAEPKVLQKGVEPAVEE